MKHALVVVALSFGILASAASPPAYAQTATRTWVSGTGSDANDCTRVAPCQTFAGALSKTAANGEINCLDPGGFGAVTITKSITIDCNGTLGGILASGGVDGVTVNAGSNGVVILRNLDIHGAGSGRDGILFMNGKTLIIENTTIAGFQGHGVLNQPMLGAGNLVISNSTISGMLSNGITIVYGNTTVSNSVITGNLGFALRASGSGVINADSNMLTYNGVAVQAGNGGPGQSAATVRLSNNDVYGNLTGFGCGGGVLASAGNNRKGSNTGGTVPACSPNAVITQQ